MLMVHAFTSVSTVFPELNRILRAARCPEDVFGTDAAAWETERRRLLASCHPDKHPDNTDQATELFHEVNRWAQLAEEKIAARTYGDKKMTPTAHIQTPSAVWGVGMMMGVVNGMACYEAISKDGATQAEVRIATHPKYNARVSNEHMSLSAINKWVDANHPKLANRFPRVLDTCGIPYANREKRQVLVLAARNPKLVPLSAVLKKGQPLPTVHGAWIFNRMIDALAMASSVNLAHNSINPDTFFINPESHEGYLDYWAYSCKLGSKPREINPDSKLFLPSRLAKGKADITTEIHQIAACLSTLMGGNAENLPHGIPGKLGNILRACRIPLEIGGYQNAAELHDAWKAALAEIFGAPKFVPFTV